MLHPTIFNNYTTELKARVADADKFVLGFAKDNAITPSLAVVSGEKFIQNNHLQDEVFGSFCFVVLYKNEHELIACLQQLVGQLTISLFVEENEMNGKLLTVCTTKAGRVIFNGVPTGVEVTTAMQHGGPFPSSSIPQSTAVGADAVKRFMRPVAFQNFPENMLPLALKKQNPLAIFRFVNGEWQQ
jgi:NADP-dependent aldehyde dehydrogenase